MEGKKISFGFMKTKKAEKVTVEDKKEFIECVEEKSIKVIGGDEVREIAPLVIPMKPNTLITAEKMKKIAEEVESAMNEPEPGEKPIEDNKPQVKPSNETLDQMAVRELLEEAKKEKKEESLELTVAVPANPIMAGEKESTLEDYEAVPIQDFGMAMLRGMGWQPNKDQSKYKQPQLRPKGLGLGADKVVSENQKKKSTKDNQEELSIVKNSYVKITTGKHSGYYGKVVSLDEDNGRVMVDIPVKKETVSMSEFMMHPVTKSEFDRESKVINADSFEAYKKNEKISQKSSGNDSPRIDKDASSSKKVERDNRKVSKEDRHREKSSSNGKSRDKERNRHRRDSSSSDDRSSRRRKEKRYSSNDSLSSLSDKDKRKHKKRYSSSDSDSSRRERRKKTPEGKRDIDKKRKGKKKKRDRDRSPNYKKHRK
ncbi:peptidyl-prolyl cis-trans isomerase G [Amyelois transitella]|uniref:peptidyl-prolyl cis-trans isomerase G n=1 Tax=Amyelois transitella TaxID=680683 RepID=UPI00298FCA8A|nr:peptidyl-prolyl cis-trans isomerase G [Amyelois transitella]